MNILFKYTKEVIEDESGFGLLSWRAELMVYLDDYRVFFRGQDPSLIEAERLCFENFLNKNWYIKTSFGWADMSGKVSIRMEYLPKGYQDLIWQLLDEMSGKDILKLVGF